MESEVLSLLCDPDTRYDFELEGSTLRNTATGRVYPIRDGIPLFVSTLTGPNLRNQALYDRLAGGYDLAESFSRILLRKPEFRREIIAALEVRPGMRVLEVGVGTGANLRFLPSEIEFFGVDISWGMLQKCRKNLRRTRRQAHLFQSEAGRLPFRAEVFDCVFHVGGINLFSDPERAIREMVWVARPGTKIVIADETEKMPQNNHQNGSTKTSSAGNEGGRFSINLIPEEMEEVSACEVAGGRFHLVSFRKPAKAKP